MSIKPKIYMMIGVPCSGKTKWARQFAVSMEGCVPLSTDEIIEKSAAAVGTSFTDAFPDLINPAQKALNATIQILSYQRASFVIDQHNITKRERQKKLALIKNKQGYDIIAVYMDTPMGVAYDRLRERNASGKTKHIPLGTLDGMYERLIEPSEREGFTKIITINERLN